MKRKNKKAKQPIRRRAHREDVVLSIVRTDNTFSRCEGGYTGKCIHCGSKVFVSSAGCTSATVEHIKPLCAGGESIDPSNLALACSRCNSEKGVRHDRYVGRNGRADEVISTLIDKRKKRWREPSAT